MIDHVSSYTTDYDTAKGFYDAVMGALGYSVEREMKMDWDAELPGRRCVAYGAGHPTFWLVQTRSAYTPRHIAFVAPDHDAVKRFYDAALAAGGKDNGAPGPRAIYHPHYFGAFVIDPDGNNVEAVCHRPMD